MSAELAEVREKFKAWVVEQGFYPKTVDPVLCYVLDVELGLDPRAMPLDQPITKKTYEVFIFEDGGKVRRDKNFYPITVTRKFTPQQQKTIRKWWPVLFGVEYV